MYGPVCEPKVKAKELRFKVSLLKEKVEEAKLNLKREEEALNALEDACGHVWGLVEYIPERIEGYRIQGDPPGTMGVDRQLPVDVPPKTIDKWKRVCTRCEKSQITTFFQIVNHNLPDFYD